MMGPTPSATHPSPLKPYHDSSPSHGRNACDALPGPPGGPGGTPMVPRPAGVTVGRVEASDGVPPTRSRHGSWPPARDRLSTALNRVAG